MYNSTFTLLITFIKILVLFFASFIFWKKLKDDYPGEKIFSLTIMILVSFVLGGRLLFILANFSAFNSDFLTSLTRVPGFLFQGAFLGGVLYLILFAKKNLWNTWQVADAAVFPFLFSVLTFDLLDLSLSWSVFRVSLAILTAVVILLSKLIEKKYRTFAWYLSGKVGFVACFSVIAFFGLFLVLEIIAGKILYWMMFVDLGIALLAGCLLYLRSERKIRQDLITLKNNIKKNGED